MFRGLLTAPPRQSLSCVKAAAKIKIQLQDTNPPHPASLFSSLLSFWRLAHRYNRSSLLHFAVSATTNETAPPTAVLTTYASQPPWPRRKNTSTFGEAVLGDGFWIRHIKASHRRLQVLLPSRFLSHLITKIQAIVLPIVYSDGYQHHERNSFGHLCNFRAQLHHSSARQIWQRSS